HAAPELRQLRELRHGRSPPGGSRERDDARDGGNDQEALHCAYTVSTRPHSRAGRTDKRTSVTSPSSCLLATSLAERGGRAHYPRRKPSRVAARLRSLGDRCDTPRAPCERKLPMPMFGSCRGRSRAAKA